MPFDMVAFEQSLHDYMANNFTIKIVDYYLDTQPIGGADQGVNFDVGEIHSFDLEYTNNGDLAILNLVSRVTCIHGRLSQSFSGFSSMAGSQWVSPWLPSIDVRPFHVGPNQSIKLRHETSGGQLFGYRLDEPTGGTDNNRDIETLLTATVKSWQPDLQNLVLAPRKDAPQAVLRSFIQRS